MTEENKKLVLIDGNSLINRAYYAIQRPMITKEGIYTQGVYGFITMLNKILNDYDPEYIAVTFDRKAPTFRHEEYEEYKAGRKKMPLELAMQFPDLKKVLEAMNIEVLEIDRYEADDIIGTAAKKGEAAGLKPVIFTGDKDELQLASDNIRIIFTKRGISEFEEYDEAAMIEKYGFTPTQFIDYKGLMGDSSDNIPGIPGVGEKTASKLIIEYGSIENLIANADSISNEKLKAKIIDNQDIAIMSKRLATIVTDVPIDIDFDKMKFIEPDIKKLAEVYTELEFKSFLSKLDIPADITQGLSDLSAGLKYFDAEIPETIITEVDELSKLKESLSIAEFAAYKSFGDNNHRAKPEIYGVSIMTESAFYYLSVEDNNALIPEIITILKETNVKLIGHDIQDDLFVLFSNGMNFDPPLVFDTSVAEYVLDPTESDYSIKTLAAKYFGVEVEDEKDVMKNSSQTDLLSNNRDTFSKYGLSYCRAVFSLKAAMDALLKQNNLDGLYYNVELPLITPLARMEFNGFTFDRNALTDVGVEVNKGIEQLVKDIYEIAGEEFNINSPKQLGPILFEKLKLPFAKKTKTGYATGAEILEKLVDESPIIEKILEYRTLTKLKGTYIDGLIPLVAKDGKLRAHFRQIVTATGRISCVEPNLQNIPIRQEFGRQIRKAFVPESDEYVLIGADYSQIELRILAHFSKDPALVNDFMQGADIHRRTAARVFGVKGDEEVTQLQRSRAKAVNFGIIYGMSSFGLSEGLGITRWEADKFIQDYFAQHEAVKKYLDSCIKDASDLGYSTTIMGRKRAIPELKSSNYNVKQFGERLAMNTPIQGSAADIMKLAMINVDTAIKEKGLKSQIILQVHDELIIQTHKDEISTLKELLKNGMESAYELIVPLTVDINEGNNWYELK